MVPEGRGDACAVLVCVSSLCVCPLPAACVGLRGQFPCTVWCCDSGRQATCPTLQACFPSVSPAPPPSVENRLTDKPSDWASGADIPQHRTETVDFGIVVFGTIEAVLDSGETRLLRPGDIIVQRGTRHAWRNPSKDQWVRCVFFLVGAKRISIGGEELGPDLPWEIPS